MLDLESSCLIIKAPTPLLKRRVFFSLQVDVHTKDGQMIRCRCYNLLKRGYKDKRPSPQYLDVIVRGAVQHDLPEYYVEKLRAIKHNEYDGKVNVMDEINELVLKSADAAATSWRQQS